MTWRVASVSFGEGRRKRWHVELHHRCGRMVQLTCTDNYREHTRRYYEALGMVALMILAGIG